MTEEQLEAKDKSKYLAWTGYVVNFIFLVIVFIMKGLLIDWESTKVQYVQWAFGFLYMGSIVKAAWCSKKEIVRRTISILIISSILQFLAKLSVYAMIVFIMIFIVCVIEFPWVFLYFL